MRAALFSRSRLYAWQRGAPDRKARKPKKVPEQTVEHAAALVARFPHLGGRKGQAYQLYHGLGYIGQKRYERIKDHVKRLLIQEVSRRKLTSAMGESFEHVRPRQVGEIWAEDFTEVVVEAETFKVAVLLDVFDAYYLGAAVERRATTALVAAPVQLALARGSSAPTQFLLSDNGVQYVGEKHEKLLTSEQIVHRLIPPCVPQYNGCVEGGMRDLKSIFYNVWERRKRQGADKEKSRLERVRATLEETLRLLNESIPRPALGGVTPADVHLGRVERKRERLKEYREQQAARPVEPWKRSYWDILKSGVALGEMSDSELQTKLSFFGRRPLRQIAKRNQESVG